MGDQMTQRQPRADAGRRTYLLAGALTVLAAFGLSRIDLHVAPNVGWALPIWAVALIAIVSGPMVFDVEFRRETYTFTFSEIILVLGLFFASPLTLVCGRLLGELVFLSVHERQPVRKIVLNLSAFFAETVVLLTVQQALLGHLDARQPASWIVALIAVVAAESVGFAAVATAVRWHGGPITFRSIVQIGLITAPANTSLTLVVCVLLDVEPKAVPLLAGVAIFLLVTYRAHSSLRQRYNSLSLLYDFTHLVSGARDPNQVLDAMLAQAKDLLRAERAEFWLFSGPHSAQRHVVDDLGHTSTDQRLPSSIAAIVHQRFKSGRDAIRIQRSPTASDERAILADIGAEDALIAPIFETETLIGFVAVVDRLNEMSDFVEQDARMFATLASHAGVALQNGRLIKRLHDQARQREHEALHDPLTGLANRVLFADRLSARFGEQGGVVDDIAIALMDLDGFKEINDTLGHQSGDGVLIEVGRRLIEIVDEGTTVARLGGDEFALLAPAGSSPAAIEETCRRIRACIAAPIVIDEITIDMGVSVGIAIAPRDGRDVETLIRRADIAMYAAKAGHGAGVCFYDANRDDNTPRRLTLAHDLRRAVTAGELDVVFQPKVSLVDGQMTGVECLCRWMHPTLGMVTPDEFIPLADRAGVSGVLTAAVLTRALLAAEDWYSSGNEWGVAVNVSMRNLVDPELVAVVRSLINQSTLPASALTLEITETHVMSDAVRTTRVLEELAELGVRLSVDDFGTGYSSLAYLQRLPVHEVKIDKSFVQDLARGTGADAIVRSVLDLARNLDLWVVAEGVETPEALERLRQLGCKEAQGYYFAKPMSSGEIERFGLARSGVADRQPELVTSP